MPSAVDTIPGTLAAPEVSNISHRGSVPEKGPWVGGIQIEGAGNLPIFINSHRVRCTANHSEVFDAVGRAGGHTVLRQSEDANQEDLSNSGVHVNLDLPR